MNIYTNDYPYLELDLIDFIYSCPDQFLTTDEVLEYIQEEYGEKEYLNLKSEAENRFKYGIKDKDEFYGSMPIEYVRDIILSCFFLNTKKLNMSKYKYTTNYTIESESRKHFSFASEVEGPNENLFYKISDFEPIISSNGSTLYAGFVFYLLKNLHDKEIKSIQSRIYGIGAELSIAEEVKDYEYHLIDSVYTGVSGLRDEL